MLKEIGGLHLHMQAPILLLAGQAASANRQSSQMLAKLATEYILLGDIAG